MAHWYDHAIIYQIYPKSFQDSNGDGIGDLNGIRQRIPYLKRLGINAVWLNPVFVSPQIDNGYDVSNYFAIDPAMGTMKDMENLIHDLHKAGIHIIMDFVLNHTSDQHPWFQDAIHNPDSIYRDYYIFEKGKNGSAPNNWGSFFGGSVWEKDPAGTGEYYFHLFDKRMPDLNWKNPEVRHAMLDVAKFWLNKGIDGLRIDAFIHIAKADLRQDFPTKNGDNKPIVAEPFFANLPQVQEWLRPFCKEIKADYPDAFLLGEAASANVNLAVDYTSKHNQLMDSVVTFRYFPENDKNVDPAFSDQYQTKELDMPTFKQNQAVWQQTLSHVSLPTLYWSNHDMARLGTRVAHNDTEQRSLAMLMYLQRGIPIIYYGEEIGMKNLAYDKPEQFHDLTVDEFVKDAEKVGKTEAEAVEMVSKNHKLPARNVMQWDEEKYYGFSTHEPWNIGRDIETTTVAEQEEKLNSMLNFYRKLLHVKQTNLFEKGTFYLFNTNENTYVYQRDYQNESAIVAISLSKKVEKVELPKENYEEKLLAGDYELKENTLELQPGSGVVLIKK